MNKSILLKNANVPSERGDLNVNLLMENGIIAYMGKKLPAQAESAEIIDCRGNLTLPGFVELHIHGAKGVLGFEASFENYNIMSECLAGHGCTSFLVSISACSHEKMLDLIARTREIMQTGLKGARLAGLHFEGPYLNPEKAGGMAQGMIRNPERAEVRKLITAGKDVIKMVTISPEVAGAFEAIRLFAENGILVAAGHTCAPASVIDEAIANGLAHVTHIFNNGEAPLVNVNGVYKESGPLLEFLCRDELTAEVICDGVHVPPAFLKLLYKTKGFSRVAAITDSCAALDHSEKIFKVTELDGSVREFEIKDALYIKGTTALVGSIIAMDKAYRNIRKLAGLSAYEAIISCSTLPAKLIKADNRGELAEGRQADIVIFNKDQSVAYTFVGGKCVYKSA